MDMDIIRNYLETMFRAYPQTPEMERAKEELSAMMEDKYNELMAEGHNQNEAVGIVIAEFGNLEEIVRDYMGMDQGGMNGGRGMDGGGIRGISYQEALEYIQDTEKAGTKIGLGVWLCVASPTILLILTGLKSSGYIPSAAALVLGISSMLVFIAAAVGLFIYAGSRMQRYVSWKKEVFWMDQATKGYVAGLREAFRSTFAANLIVGIVICMVSMIPIVVAAVSGHGNPDLLLPGVGIALFLAGLGVYFFIGAGMRQSCYDVLLQEKEYAKEKKEKRKKSWGKYEDTYWIMVTVVYFVISFWTRKWGVTWVIWILAAGLQEAVKKGK